jgi:hypothetical protein
MELDKQQELCGNPICFESNNEVYPLCIGRGKEECKDCCVYEDYERYHDPYER